MGVVSQVYVMVTSAGSCRTGEVEGVGAVEQCVLADCEGWVLNLFYCLCGDLLEGASLAKGSRMLGWLGQLPDGQEISVGCEQAGLGWEVVLPMVSA